MDIAFRRTLAKNLIVCSTHSIAGTLPGPRYVVLQLKMAVRVHWVAGPVC